MQRKKYTGITDRKIKVKDPRKKNMGNASKGEKEGINRLTAE